MGVWSAGSSIAHGAVTVSATITAEPDYVAGGPLDITYSESGGFGYYGGMWYRSLPPGGTPGSWVMIRWQSMGGSPLTQSYGSVTMPPYWQVVLSASDGSTNVESYYDPDAVAPPVPPEPGSAAAVIPVLLGDVDGLPTTTVADTAPTSAVNSWDAAQDIADRSEVRLVDRGSGWEALPALPVPGDPVLHVEHTVNLISADSVVDIDQSDWAQSALVVYRWEDEYDPNPEDGEPGVPYTRTVSAWSDPQHGTDTMVEVRDGIPATEAQAQTVADVLGARAWLRGHSLEVVTTCCAWVRIGDTVRVSLPWAPTADYWCAEARHDSPACTSTLTLRPFELTYYPEL